MAHGSRGDAAGDLGLEEDGEDALAGDALEDLLLDAGVGLALVVVVLHVVEAGELGLGDDGVALGARVVLGRADGEVQDVRLAILDVDGSCQLLSSAQNSTAVVQLYLLVVRGQLAVLVEDDLLLVRLGDLEQGDAVDAVRHGCGCRAERSGERTEEASLADGARKHLRGKRRVVI
jgi:hypothetical protein